MTGNDRLRSLSQTGKRNHRALPTGVTGTTRSARAWLLRIVNSRWITFVSNPIVAWALAFMLSWAPPGRSRSWTTSRC